MCVLARRFLQGGSHEVVLASGTREQVLANGCSRGIPHEGCCENTPVPPKNSHARVRSSSEQFAKYMVRSA
jgi:hypothetical protein